jgi:LacI family transcriptional regulator
MTPPPPKIRLIDIAKKAGVSSMAVSSVLNSNGNGKTRVSRETSERIRQIAAELKYEPNLTAQQLAGAPCKLIGVIAKDWFQNTRMRLLAAMHRVADPYSQRVFAMETRGEARAMREYLRECRSRNVDGIIYVPDGDDTLLPEAREMLAEMPNVVSLMFDAQIPSSHVVLSDYAAASESLIDHFVEHGRRRIACVMEDPESLADGALTQGIRRGLEKHKLAFGPETLFTDTKSWTPRAPNYLSYCDQIVEELVVHRKADAIFVHNDIGAMAVQNCLTRRGLQPGKDVAVAGWANHTFDHVAIVPLTSVNLKFQELASAAIKLIAENRGKPATQQRQRIVVKPELVIREST